MNPTLFLPHDFLSDFKERIARAKKRVWLQAMVVETGEIMDQVEPLLLNALKRGVEVKIYYDWVTQEYFHGEIRLLPSFNTHQNQIEKEFHQKNTAFFKRMQNAGAEVIEVNRPLMGKHVLPVMGRNHIKIYVVDDVAWMGGMNFFDENFEVLDFLVLFDEYRMVEILAKQFEMVNNRRPAADFTWDVGEIGTLVVDSGKILQSLIYTNALELVSSAQTEIVFASQLVPENQMLDLLMDKAAEGVQITVYTSNVEDKSFNKYPFKYFYDEFRKRIQIGRGAITFVHLNKKIHAKVVLVDGREVMFGSHNFVESGVRMGTQEISLRTRLPALVSQVQGFTKMLEEYKG